MYTNYHACVLKPSNRFAVSMATGRVLILISKTFEWVDKFDLRDAPYSRRVQRAMEKENKKIREAAETKQLEFVNLNNILAFGLK